jgi:hypothetical protein
MFRFFFEHLKTTITHINIYLNEHDSNREVDIKLNDFRELADAYRKEHDPNHVPKKNTRSKSKKPADPAPSQNDPPPPPVNKSPASLEATRFLKSLDFTVEKFYKAWNSCVGIMNGEPKGYVARVSPETPVRFIATSGFTWNVDSKNRWRDFGVASVAAVFEAKFVAQYRPALITKCSGVAAMRKQLSDYLFTIAKSNTVEEAPKPSVQAPIRKPISKKEWFFADLIDVDKDPLPLRPATFKELQEKLDSSHVTFANRKNNEIGRNLGGIMNSKYIACSEDDADPGTLETAAYLLLNALNVVSFPSHPHARPSRPHHP